LLIFAFLFQGRLYECCVQTSLLLDIGTVTVEGVSIPVVGVQGLDNGCECTLVLRPESAVLSDNGQLPCEVILACFIGAYQNYHVMVGDTLVKITDFNPKSKRSIMSATMRMWISRKRMYMLSVPACIGELSA